MAKIRIRQGPNEIEIDSRDFYIDNDSVEEVVESLKQLLHERPKTDVMSSLEDAEFHEPEFSSPSTIAVDDIKNKLRILAKDSFFDQPKSVGETVAHRLSPAVLTLSDEGVMGIKVVNEQNIVEFLAVTLVADTPEGAWLGGLPLELELISVGHEFVKQGQKVIPVRE